MLFRKKPVVVDAEQYRHNQPCRGVYGHPNDGEGPYCITIHGQKTHVVDRDWIIAEPDGEHFYPCKPDIFEKTYEPVSTPDSGSEQVAV